MELIGEKDRQAMVYADYVWVEDVDQVSNADVKLQEDPAVTDQHASAEAARKVLEITTRFVNSDPADWTMRQLVLGELLIRAEADQAWELAGRLGRRHAACDLPAQLTHQVGERIAQELAVSAA